MSITKKFMTWIFGKAIEEVMDDKVKAEIGQIVEDRATKPITKRMDEITRRMDETNAFVIAVAKGSSGLSKNRIQEAKKYAEILKDSDPDTSLFDRLIDVGIKKDDKQNPERDAEGC